MEWYRPVRKWDWKGGEKLPLPLFPELHCLLFMVLWNTSRTCQWSPFSAKRSSEEFYSPQSNDSPLQCFPDISALWRNLAQAPGTCTPVPRATVFGEFYSKTDQHKEDIWSPKAARELEERWVEGACELRLRWNWSVEIPSQWQAVLRPLLPHGPSHWGQSFESRRYNIRCTDVLDVSVGDAERQGNRHGASSLQPCTSCSKKAAGSGLGFRMEAVNDRVNAWSVLFCTTPSPLPPSIPGPHRPCCEIIYSFH